MLLSMQLVPATARLSVTVTFKCIFIFKLTSPRPYSIKEVLPKIMLLSIYKMKHMPPKVGSGGDEVLFIMKKRLARSIRPHMSDTSLCQDTLSQGEKKKSWRFSCSEATNTHTKNSTARSAGCSPSHKGPGRVRRGYPVGTVTADLHSAPMCGPGANPQWEGSGSHVRLVLRWKNAIRAQNGCQ